MNYAEQLTAAWAALPHEQDELVEAARAAFCREREQLPALLRKYAEQARDPTRGVRDAIPLWQQVELLALPGEYAAIEKLTGIKCQNNKALFGAWVRKKIRAHRKVPGVMLTCRRARNKWLRQVPWSQLTPFEWWVIYRSIALERTEVAATAVYLIEPISRTLRLVSYLVRDYHTDVLTMPRFQRAIRFGENFGVGRALTMAHIDEQHYVRPGLTNLDAERLMRHIARSIQWAVDAPLATNDVPEETNDRTND